MDRIRELLIMKEQMEKILVYNGLRVSEDDFNTMLLMVEILNERYQIEFNEIQSSSEIYYPTMERGQVN